MDKITEALKKLLPDTEINEVSGAVKEMLEEAKAQLEKEFNEKLEEAYAELSTELKTAEETAIKGYEEAAETISELRSRLETQGEEYKTALEEGYERAYQLIKSEQERASTSEVEMYEEYDKKLNEMREYIVEKLDQFLKLKGQEIYENAKRDCLNHPRMAEHKVALDRIVDITADYLSDEDFNAATSKKLEEISRQHEELKGQLKIMEARNIKLSTENTKLNESTRRSQEMLNEQKKADDSAKKSDVIKEQNERAEKAKNVTGRGQTTTDEAIVVEQTGELNGEFTQLQVLAGLKSST